MYGHLFGSGSGAGSDADGGCGVILRSGLAHAISGPVMDVRGVFACICTDLDFLSPGWDYPEAAVPGVPSPLGAFITAMRIFRSVRRRAQF